MNLYLIQIISKFLRMLFVAFISFLNITIYNENDTSINNSITNKNSYSYNMVVLEQPVIKNEVTSKAEVKESVKNVNVVNKKITTQNIQSKQPVKQVQTVKPVEKTQAVNNTNKQLEKTQTMNNVDSSKKPIETFTGRLTGYGPDCAGCSGKGNVACMTKEKKKHSLVTNGIYYEDSQYGKVRILSAATSKFKCGTIVEIKKDGQEPFYGIVLDSGGDMRKAWANGSVWMDLAYSSNAMSGSDNKTGKNLTFNIYRYGW